GAEASPPARPQGGRPISGSRGVTHVGKMGTTIIEGPATRDAVTAAGSGGTAADTGGPPGSGSGSGLARRVGPDSRDGAEAGSMHLPGLWGPDRSRSPSRAEAIPRGPRRHGDSPSRLSCADRRPV